MAADPDAKSFADVARRLRRQVDEALVRYTEYGDDCPVKLAQAIRHSLLAPAKRLRPMLVLMSCQACGCDPRAALPAACAVEMVHTYSLIHDDLPAMDDDDMRRGQPSCHAKFGEATAILAGDALLAQAFEILATDIQPPTVAARCCRELALAAGASNLVGGQQDDLTAEHERGGIEQLEKIHRRKTGAMIGVSLRLGGILGGASNTELAGLDIYGANLGLAFQIVDDLLDLGGDATKLGKRTGKDSTHGKLTFPAVLSVEGSRQRARQLIDEAKAALAIFGSRAAALESLADYVIERDH
ncbi:MAG TPA: farnesyl diphosphate synthase [Pirellulaceae bacterium]|jgi:geranylgeranyl diphosphate synthase type II